MSTERIRRLQKGDMVQVIGETRLGVIKSLLGIVGNVAANVIQLHTGKRIMVVDDKELGPTVWRVDKAASLCSTEQLSELKKDFDLRKQSYVMMCGTIYPDILYDEMKDVQEKYIQGGGSWKDVQMPRHPDALGDAR